MSRRQFARLPRASKSPRKPQKRRMPVQSRARLTRKSILEATEILLKKQSYTQISTTQIADLVGISVGSLYQYFPNKEAIAHTLLETTSLHAARQLREQIYSDIQMDDLQLFGEQGSLKTLSTLLAIYEEHQAVLIRLLEDAPELREKTQALTLDTLIHNVGLIFLKERVKSDELNIDLIKFMLDNFIFSNIKEYVRTDPKPFPRDEFVRELTYMLLKYYQSLGMLE